MDELKKLLEQRVVPRRKKRFLPTPGHALADEISEYLNEPTKYPMYLQFVKRLGYATVRANFDEVRRADVDDKRALFMWLCSARGLQERQARLG
jgi:hypothetical protein